MRERLVTVLALILGGFILYTSATGPFQSLVHRGVFLALVLLLGLVTYPLGVGTRWRPAAIALDLALAAVSVVACGFVALNHERILTELPWATPLDMAMTAALVIAILEVSRRAIGLIFPSLVLIGIGYAFFGNLVPGALQHRGFDVAFVTETLFLGDLGIWGMLVGVASTTIAAFVLFGSVLLHTGGGQTFIDLSMRIGGRSPGGAAKVATVASGLFGMVSGSAVANVATTGNFTIPMMKRLGYSPALAGAVEAVASTGGQIAPPILGAAAFVMAEILGVSYLRIAAAALLPAILFYVAVFLTVHLIAVRRGLRLVPDDEMPAWATILKLHRTLPILAALGGLFFGVLSGRSIATSAFFGVAAMAVCFVTTAVAAGLPARTIAQRFVDGLVDAGKGMVIIGVLLAGAQILVAMINLTGVGVALTGLIVGLAGHSVVLVAIIVAVVCLLMGMGIPTTAAYVLVSAVLAPALTEIGVEPLIAHLFVFYFATVSVITPPVCVAVFVASGIAKAHWIPVAGEAVRLGATTYVVPFLLLVYPAMAGFGTWTDVALALCQGLLFVAGFAALLAGARLTGSRAADIGICAAIIVLALLPGWGSTALSLAILAALAVYRRRRAPRERPPHATLRTKETPS